MGDAASNAAQAAGDAANAAGAAAREAADAARPVVEQGGSLLLAVLSWLVVGLVVGAVAKLLMPGRDGGGFVLTSLLGIAGALDSARLAEALSLLRSQQSLAGATLNLEPRTLLVPAAFEVAARKLVREIELASSAPLEVLADAHLSGTAFYLAADPQSLAGFVRGTLGEAETPTIISRVGFTTDTVDFRITHDVAIGPLNPRAMTRSPGA